MTNKAKYTSVYTIIAKAYRDMGLGEEIDLSNAVEWAGEAIEFIGSAYSLIDEREILRIIEGRAKLPCNLHYVNTIRAYVTDEDLTTCFEEDRTGETVKWLPMTYGTDSFHKKARYCVEDTFDQSCPSKLTYILNDDYIFTNFDSGYVNISYKAIPVDDNGWPLIPDDIKFKNAVAYHIMMKLAFIKLMQGTISESIYQKIAQDRDWYVGAAQTRGHMPSVDLMEALKNNLIRLIPKINHHSDSFASLGNQEQRNNLSSKRNRGR